MILYHSSTLSIPRPDTLHSRDYLDFGKGFYLTTLREQAIKYAQRFVRRQQPGWLNAYEFNFNSKDWKVLEFDKYGEEWLRFVSKCRNGEDDTDMI